MHTRRSYFRVSVIVNSKNRPQQLQACIDSISNGQVLPFEVLIIDQSVTPAHILLPPFAQRFVRKKGSVSEAKNFALMQARCDIVAFTDDDCLVAPDWVKHIALFFQNNPAVSGVFGRTLPYRPKEHPGMVCPAVFDRPGPYIIRKPVFHADSIGFGNNMAFRKEALHATGGFRQWLGPGTIGQAAEDAEISMRLLLHGRTLAYEPNILVYHDKWLTTRGARRQQIPYARGETACYGYYYFHKHRFARLIIARAFQRETSDLIKWIGDLLRIRWNRKTLGSVWWISWSLLNRIEGLVIGFVASHLDPLTVRSAARKNP